MQQHFKIVFRYKAVTKKQYYGRVNEKICAFG